MYAHDRGTLAWVTGKISSVKDGKSLIWLFAILAMFVTFFGWGFLANSYAISHHTPTSKMAAGDDAMGRFIAISIEQLQNVSSVITWHFENRIWLPILVIFAEVGVIGGFVVLKKVETALSLPRHTHKRRSARRDR
jgi:hypothetical protein